MDGCKTVRPRLIVASGGHRASGILSGMVCCLDSVPIKAEAPYLPSSNQMGTGAAMPRTGAQNQSGSPFG
eukprot:3191834-Ditylum_brightwellii.AAC.1